MANYTSDLKSWGKSGTEYPDGYGYTETEPPVDAWDNFLVNGLINDVRNHLIPLTNDRIESDVGGSGGEPASPETSHIYHDQANERLEMWDSENGEWRGLMFRDGDILSGQLNLGGNAITGFRNLTDENGNVIWNYSEGHVPSSQLEINIPTLTSDPSNPDNGEIWVREDL